MVHLKDTTFKCDACNAQYTSRQNLMIHVNAKHKKEGAQMRYDCSKCDFSTLIKLNLKNHIKAIHDQIKDNKCSLCALNIPLAGLQN